MRKKKTYSPNQKLRAALELSKGEKTAVEIAREIGCHPTMISEWRNILEKEGKSIFEQSGKESQKDQKIAKLERLIGKMSVQNDFLEGLCDRSN